MSVRDLSEKSDLWIVEIWLMPGRESRAVSMGLKALVMLTLETRACCIKHHFTQHFIPSWYQNPNSWDT